MQKILIYTYLSVLSNLTKKLKPLKNFCKKGARYNTLNIIKQPNKIISFIRTFISYNKNNSKIKSFLYDIIIKDFIVYNIISLPRNTNILVSNQIHQPAATSVQSS